VRGDAVLGVVLGGSGQGEQIAANKVIGARAALCHDEWMAEMARRHNDANILAMGGRVIAAERATLILQTFLITPFDGGRHARRVAQIADLERENT
jgi:ribose 5-phosphate isomerase B